MGFEIAFSRDRISRWTEPILTYIQVKTTASKWSLVSANNSIISVTQPIDELDHQTCGKISYESHRKWKKIKKIWNMLKLGQKWVQMVHSTLTKWFLIIWDPFLAKKLKKSKILIFAPKHRFWNRIFTRILFTWNWAYLDLSTCKINF